ncbi:PQQ-dependent sugar dehydrogenase [Actinoplanes sp. NBRC 103695]|uniref:PQQ-dependent sugar dehydrogenase n=1 Tax=Actinoplanes sp. NBRC 103695 TaxID=3032202 RepID=UPI0024A560A4|nr:PQQ-dependent sugar dehydrogenase [Actinoplanes sp. NBRC 103695]GLY99774.1 oxidoreductase [Actinoplanes sp. NBRC 103695]
MSPRVRSVAVVLAATMAVTSACAFGPPDPDVAGEPPNLPTPSAPSGSASPGSPGGDEQEVAVTVLAKGLDVPWGMAFLPDGGALVTERDTHRILQVGPESDADGLKVAEVQRLTEPVSTGDGGLLGIAVSPKYAQDKTVYVYYTTAKDNRVGKLQLGGKVTPVLTGLPRSETANGGQIAFGPDGYLYVGTADATEAGTLAQNPKSTGGKILRMTVAGKPAPGNPVKTSLVWSSGHHNVLGMAWDSAKRMYASETGQITSGELNVITKGKNYGWPAADGDSPNAKFTNPLVTWPVTDSSCAGVAVLERTIATACLLGQRIWMVSTTGNGTLIGQPRDLLKGEYGRLRGLVAGPDGSLWVATSNQERGGEPKPGDDRIIRLVFTDGGAGRS